MTHRYHTNVGSNIFIQFTSMHDRSFMLVYGEIAEGGKGVAGRMVVSPRHIYLRLQERDCDDLERGIRSFENEAYLPRQVTIGVCPQGSRSSVPNSRSHLPIGTSLNESFLCCSR